MRAATLRSLSSEWLWIKTSKRDCDFSPTWAVADLVEHSIKSPSVEAGSMNTSCDSCGEAGSLRPYLLRCSLSNARSTPNPICQHGQSVFKTTRLWLTLLEARQSFGGSSRAFP